MIGQASNPLLAKVEQGVQAKVPPALQDGLSRVVHAGMSILYAPTLKAQLQQRIAQTKNPAQEAGQGAARMITELYAQSKKTMPGALIMPAAMIFALEYVDLLAKAGKAQVTPSLIDQLTQTVSDSVLQAMGITKDKLQQIIAARQGGAAPGAVAPPAAASAPPPGIIGAQVQGA